MYHRLFHIAQLTIHDRWVKRLRFLAFLSASSIATQIVLRSALGSVGMGSLLPASIVMWLRMMAVVVEMEAKKEYEVVRREIQKLHPHNRAPTADPKSKSTPQPPNQIRSR
jgi:hypothetical protein